MSDEKIEKSFLKYIIEGIKLEWGTPAGRFNVFFTTVVTGLVILYSIGNVSMTIIYAICFKEKYPLLILEETVKYPLIWGGLCFAFMVYIAMRREKISKAIKSEDMPKEEEIKEEEIISKETVTR